MAIWARTKAASTRDLLRTEHRPQAGARRSYRALLWGVLLLAAGFAAQQAWRSGQEAELQARIAQLQAQNGVLTQALEQQRLRQSEAQATREQLGRRIDEMSAQIKKLKTSLAFYRQQKPSR